jgi:hypothetical protein
VKQKWIVDLILFILASPILLVLFLLRTWQHGKFLRLAATPSLICECGRTVSLVGIWRCGCGFTYRGHLLRICPVCGSLPSVVRCYGCRITTKLPEPYHDSVD